MPERNTIKTRIGWFGRDLQSLSEFMSTGGADALRQWLEAGRASGANVESAFPGAVISLILGFLSPVGFFGYRQNVAEESLQDLEELRSEVAREFGFLNEGRYSDALVSFLERRYPPRDENDDDSAIVAAFRAPTNIEMLPLFAGEPPKLTPVVRAVFLGEKNEALLDTTLDWYDIAFILANFTQALAKSLEVSQPLLAAKLVSMPERLLADTKKFLEQSASDLSKARDGIGRYPS